MRNRWSNKHIQRTVKSGVSLRYTLLFAAADVKQLGAGYSTVDAVYSREEEKEWKLLDWS